MIRDTNKIDTVVGDKKTATYDKGGVWINLKRREIQMVDKFRAKYHERTRSSACRRLIMERLDDLTRQSRQDAVLKRLARQAPSHAG